MIVIILLLLTQITLWINVFFRDHLEAKAGNATKQLERSLCTPGSYVLHHFEVLVLTATRKLDQS